tara:strand:+ start:108 stop:632 length:525 start_codon:yes stop_codon:yes gene_type:complete
MRIFKAITFIFVIFSIFNTNLLADTAYFLDLKYVLNESDAGKKAQNTLKSKLENGIKKIKEKEKALQDEEKKIIQQKKVISVDEYKKRVTELRKKVASLQKERKNLLDSIGKQRMKAKTELLKNLNPLIKEYMKEKKIRMVVDKKGILVADENLDITKEILTKLNSKLKSLKLN